MGLPEDAAARFKTLADHGERIASATGRNAYVPPELFHAWRIQCRQSLRSYLPDSDPNISDFEALVKDGTPWDARAGAGLLSGLEAAAENGELYTRVTNLITAHIFNDFLEMADHLIQNNYHIAAASLIGGVLEDTLRKLADIHNVAYSGWGKLYSLNNDLLKAGAYNEVVHGQIDVWRNVRNFADHGDFRGNVKDEDVEDLLKGVRNLIAEHIK